MAFAVQGSSKRLAAAGFARMVGSLVPVATTRRRSNAVQAAPNFKWTPERYPARGTNSGGIVKLHLFTNEGCASVSIENPDFVFVHGDLRIIQSHMKNPTGFFVQ